MKKLLVLLLAGASAVASADTFQDMNNNLYATYQYTGLNGSSAQEASNYGIGGTFQSKNNVWFNANALSGTNNSTTSSSLGFAAGYAFQFFGDENQGFQVIPHANFGAQNGAQVSTVSSAGTQYIYGLGVKPEYRLLNSLKVAVDMNLMGTQSSLNGNSTQLFVFNMISAKQYCLVLIILMRHRLTITQIQRLMV